MVKTIIVTEIVNNSNVEERYYEFAPDYYISKTLKVYSLKRKKQVNPNPITLTVAYTVKGKGTKDKLQNIAAKVFLDKEPKKKYVVFKDGDSNNRHISNLIRTSDKNKYFNRNEERTIKEEVFIDGIPTIQDVKIRNAGQKGIFASEYSKIYSINKGGLTPVKMYYRSTGSIFLWLHDCRIDCKLLVMRAFYPELEEKEYILCRDGFQGNKHYTNYMWSDEPEIQSDHVGVYPGFTKYKFSRNGSCKSYYHKEPRLIKPQMDENGYFSYSLTADSGKSYTIGRNRIVAKIFIPNPNNLPQVDHNNRKRWDDRVENLSWVTASENNLNKDFEEILKTVWKPVLQFDCDGNFLNKFKNSKEASAILFQDYGVQAQLQTIRKCCCVNKQNSNTDIKNSVAACGFIWRYLHEKQVYILKEGEIAVPLVGDFGDKKYDQPGYKITNFGNILNKNGYILSKFLNDGYPHIILRKESIRLHRCVAFFFVTGRTNERVWVNHKDENKSNAHYLNLEWVTPSENTLYSKHKTEKAVDQYDEKNGEFIKRFKSGTEAAKEIGCVANGINSVCRLREGTIFGFIWRFSDLTIDHPDPIKVQIKNKNERAVNKYTKDGVFLISYPSIKEAAKISGISQTCVGNCCRGVSKTSGGFVWKFAAQDISI